MTQCKQHSYKQRFFRAIYAFFGGILGLGSVVLLHANIITTDTPWLIAAFGATAVLLYGYPDAPAARPRYLFGGSILAAITGIIVATLLIQQPVWFSAMIAVALALFVMAMTDTMHPPGGAIAFIAVASPNIQHMGFIYVLYPITTGISIMFAIAWLMRKIQNLSN